MAWALCLAFLFTSYSNSQDISTTGNLVNFTNQANSVTSTWQNAGTIGEPLTCWAYGDPGYCGPLPRVAAWGTGTNVINFSYGLTDLNQVVNIKNALPNSGTGLQVNGFNFGFTAKNGNGWDNGMQDYLTAYVNIYNNTNSKVLEAYNYNVNQQYNWTQFYYSETFKSPYGVPNLGNAQYGFVGKDNNFWVGPYGPEITNVNFSLKYSVDPCATNPLYSPTCKGYMDALAKLAPAPVAVEDAPPLPPEDGMPPPPPPGSPPPPSGTPLAGPPLAGPPPPAGSQPKSNENKSAKEDSKAGPSLGTVLSMINTNQARIGNQAKEVVQAAEAAAAKDAQQAQQQAEEVAGSLTAQSVASSMTTNGSSTTQTNMSSQVSTNVAIVNTTQSSVVNTNGLRAPTQNIFADPNITMNNNTSFGSTEMYSLQSPQGRNSSMYEVEVPQNEGIKIGSRSVLNDVIEERPVAQSTNTQEQKTDLVNRNVQPNELAGKVDIASIATQPAGYQAYSVMIPDVAFYAPKEIYKNQVNVDNVRTLRGLQSGSDRLHQEMVNQQYRVRN